MKRTSRGRSAGARDVTLEDDSLFIFAGFWIWTRDRGEQSSGVLVLRITVQVRRLRELHNAAEIHDRDPIADVLNEGQVVSNEAVGQPEFALQVSEQVDALRLNRRIERAHWFSQDQEVEFDRKRTGDVQTLTLVPAELVRIPVDVLRPKVNFPREFDQPLTPVPPPPSP